MDARRALVGALVMGALLGAAPAALGAARWHGPDLIGPTGVRPDAALAAHGEALVAWAAGTGRPASWRVQVKVRHGVRSPWHGPLTIATGTGWNTPTPVGALNAHGDALVVWRPESGPVQVASRVGWHGAWRVGALPSGPPITGDPTFATFAGAQVALAADGSAAVLWATQELSGAVPGVGFLPGRYVIRGARRGGRRGGWHESPALALAPVVDIGWTVLQPHLGVDPAGDAVAMWINATPESVQTPLAEGAILAARRTGDQPWSEPATLADPAGLGDVAIAANGRAAAVWQERAPSYGTATPMSLALGEPGASGWGRPETLPGIGRQPCVAVNSRADVLVGWAEPGFQGSEAQVSSVLHAAVRPAGAPWGQVGTSGSRGLWADQRPLLDEAGRGYLLSTDTGGTEAEGRGGGAMAGSAAGWPRSGRVGGPGGVHLAAGPDGTALFLSTAPEVGLEASSYDGSPLVRVRTTIRGRWDARARVARWTLRVRNAGRGRALGVSVGVGLGEGESLAAARPRARLSRVPPRLGGGRLLTWRLGTMAPGAVRTLRLTLRERPTPTPGTQLNVRAVVAATQMGRTFPLGTLTVPRA